MNVWRDRLSRWFTPLARRCPLSPNSISLLALLLNLAAALCFYWRWFLVGMALVVVGGLADALDGIVARVQGKESRYGDFLDHFLDRVSDTALAAGWLLGNGARGEIVATVVALVGLNGYIGTQIEATWQKRTYDTVGRGEFVLALIVLPIVSHILYANGWERAGAGGLTIAELLALVVTASAVLAIVQRLRLAGRLERGS